MKLKDIMQQIDTEREQHLTISQYRERLNNEDKVKQKGFYRDDKETEKFENMVGVVSKARRLHQIYKNCEYHSVKGFFKEAKREGYTQSQIMTYLRLR